MKTETISYYKKTTPTEVPKPISILYNDRILTVQIAQNESYRLMFSVFSEKTKTISYAAYNNNGDFSYSIYLNEQLRGQGLGRYTFQLAKTLNSGLFSQTKTATANWGTGDNYTFFTNHFKTNTQSQALPFVHSKEEFDNLDSKTKQILIDGAKKTFTGKIYWETFHFTPTWLTTDQHGISVHFEKLT